MKKLLSTAAILAFAGTTAMAEDADDQQMRELTQSVLLGITGQPPAAQEDSASQGSDLSSIISQAMQEGQSDEYLNALIDEAVDRGELEVPEAMVSTEGNVDTQTLLASLVSESLQGTPENSVLRAEANGGSVAPSEPRRHEVVSGESLAGIALQYYGDATEFRTIFEANRDKIDRPNLIQVGQVLLIP